MVVVDQIKKFQEFLEDNYIDLLSEKIRKGENFLVVDFSLLASFDPELADTLLEEPEDSIKAAELAVENFDIGDVKGFRIRFTNLPKSQEIMVRNIRSEHIGKFMSIRGVVRQKSDVRPQVTTARFECPSCGQIITVLQLDSAFKEPSKCSCGRKGKFRLLSKELVDAQGIVLEEVPEDIEGGEQPKRINILLKNDLVSPISERKTQPGSKILVMGMIKEIPIILRSGTKSTRSDLIIEANCVESVEETFYEIEITKKEEKEIKKLAQDPKLFKKLVNSVAPSIYGYDRIKEALILQLAGGVQKTRADGTVVRGDMHVLLVGDPGSGKSQLLKRITLVAPKGRYISGKGVSAAGLTATVVKDEFLRGWSLEAGAMVLASNGICCIDELDKMGVEDRAAMHEALENQTISISKANIQATLLARTTVLAAANPKFGRFDPYDVLAKQIDMPPTLINRFDLIFPIKDLPDKETDQKMATHILALHQAPELELPEVPTKLLKKYFAYARQRINPKLTDGAIEEIKNYYIEMRTKETGEEVAVRTIPISARQLEALVRLSEASARIRLSDKVLRKDARRAISLLHHCLSEIGIDQTTGKIDIDKIVTGITASQRGHIVTIKEIIADLEGRIGKTIPIDDVLKEAADSGIEDAKAEEVIERLKRSGDVFEPKRGFIQRI